MPINKRQVLIFMAASATLLCSGAHAQSALETITKTKKITIAVPTDYPPYGYVGTSLQSQGLDIDMANYVAKKLGATATLVPVTSTNRVQYLQTRKVDLVISTLGKTEERAKVIDFTGAYSPFLSGIYAAKNTPITSYADLNAKTVGVTRGTIEDHALDTLAPKDAKIMRFEDHASNIGAFASGQTMTIASSQPAIASLMQKNPKLSVEYKLDLSQSPNHIGVNKNEKELLAKVNEIVLQAKKDGYLNELAMKWLGRPATNLPD